LRNCEQQAIVIGQQSSRPTGTTSSSADQQTALQLFVGVFDAKIILN
jgi:hypothetical protein